MIELPIKNFLKQQSIFDSTARYTIVAKGRRFGLTKGSANDFIRCALEGSFKKGLWVDTVNTNIDKYIERYFIPHLNKLPRNVWTWRKQAKMIVINDSYIDFRSADTPETMEGFGYDKAFLNEAGIILKDEYLWNNAIMPMFWDYPNAKVVIGGTPKGKGKFYELYQRGLDPGQTNYKSFHFTSFDSPFEHIHKTIREDLKSMPDRVVEQEIYAKFLEDTGVVFRNFQEVMDAVPAKPQVRHRYIMGVDLAKVEDFTVIAVYDTFNNRQVYQARFNKIDWGMQKARIAETARHFNDGSSPRSNPASVVIDATGLGDPIVDDLARMGIPVDPIKFTNDMKRQLIEKFVNWIELKRVHLLPIQETKTELTNFTYDISETTERVRYEAPVGFHDDCFIKGTLILTDKGQVPIERIKAGDMVLTRKGVRPVIFTRSKVKEVITNKILGLTGTPDHPIITKDGEKSLQSICDSDIIYIWNEKLSYIEEKSIIDIQSQNADSLRFTFGGMISGKSHHLRYIDKFGLTILVRYLLDILFTIKTETRSIIQLKILKLLKKESIIEDICLSRSRGQGQEKMVRNKQRDWLDNLESGKRKTQNLYTKSQLKMERNLVERQHLKDGAIIERVYNFQVGGVPEYFANNILVHNCVIAHALAVWRLVQKEIPLKVIPKTRIRLSYEKQLKEREYDEGIEIPAGEFNEWGA